MIAFDANLDDIYASYFTETNAGTALEIISSDSFDRSLLDGKIVSHAAGVDGWGRELRPVGARDAIREMISGFSVLELAAMAGLVSMASFASDSSLNEPLIRARRDFYRRTRKVLESDVVKGVGENYSPFLMARLFFLRICGRGVSVESSFDGAAFSAFMDFLQLDDYFNRNIRNGAFLEMMAGGSVDGYRLRDIKKLIVDSPYSFSAQFLPETKRDDELSVACGEFVHFLCFCRELFDFLKGLEDVPVFQSAVWHHYGYLFDNDLSSKNLMALIESFSHWERFVGGGIAANNIVDYAKSASAIWEDLSSHRYRRSVPGFLDDVSFSHMHGLARGVGFERGGSSVA